MPGYVAYLGIDVSLLVKISIYALIALPVISISQAIACKMTCKSVEEETGSLVTRIMELEDRIKKLESTTVLTNSK